MSTEEFERKVPEVTYQLRSVLKNPKLKKKAFKIVLFKTEVIS